MRYDSNELKNPTEPSDRCGFGVTLFLALQDFCCCVMYLFVWGSAFVGLGGFLWGVVWFCFSSFCKILRGLENVGD